MGAAVGRRTRFLPFEEHLKTTTASPKPRVWQNHRPYAAVKRPSENHVSMFSDGLCCVPAAYLAGMVPMRRLRGVWRPERAV
ncbi:hypothetical protein HMPREF9123_1312 [Neisseria bacilliformis ATCC BAA-1200]|uniref:Uncharacterized protein n=1 Tax=Neisseria bacilliformis ATCC BAA-1200 TaxID=888742 RepID=F2BC57_9NEIS|nr:hypothetical protein HMPREF9123_1312 [Neisseria bacilliformis ATCC BAA-1200]